MKKKKEKEKKWGWGGFWEITHPFNPEFSCVYHLQTRPCPTSHNWSVQGRVSSLSWNFSNDEKEFNPLQKLNMCCEAQQPPGMMFLSTWKKPAFSEIPSSKHTERYQRQDKTGLAEFEHFTEAVPETSCISANCGLFTQVFLLINESIYSFLFLKLVQLGFLLLANKSPD